MYCGTTAKTLAGGLRLGWMVLPDELVAPVCALRAGGPGLVLGYGVVPPEAAERGVRLLADAVRAIAGPPADPRRARVH